MRDWNWDWLKNSLPFLGLVLAALGTFWLLHVLELEAQHKPLPDDFAVPDYTLKQFNLLSLNQDGTIQRQLQALDMVHFDRADAQFVRPYLVGYEAGLPVLYAHSEYGSASSDGKLIRMLGQAWLWRYNAEGQRILELVSRDVTLVPDQEYAETAAYAELRTPGVETTGVGLRAFLQTNYLEFLSQVKSLYEPGARSYD